jgi:hypothetical protein
MSDLMTDGEPLTTDQSTRLTVSDGSATTLAGNTTDLVVADVARPELTSAERNRNRHPWMCSAHLRNGSGELCRKPRMVGQSICASHGGQAPQNRKAAARRFIEFLDPIAGELFEAALQPSGYCPTCGRQADAVKLRAMIAALDRGFSLPADPEDGGELNVSVIRRVIVDPRLDGQPIEPQTSGSGDDLVVAKDGTPAVDE